MEAFLSNKEFKLKKSNSNTIFIIDILSIKKDLMNENNLFLFELLACFY